MNVPKIESQSTLTAFVAPLSKRKFICIANNAPVGKSGDETYFSRHYIENDLKKLEGVKIDKFVYLTPAGKVDHIDLVSRATKVISRLITSPSKSDREQLRKESKEVFNQVKELRLKLVA